jgi:hypothetical protein
MTTIAAPRAERRVLGDGVPAWLKFLFSGGVITVLVSVALGLGVPMMTRMWQNREKRIELKTLVATDMSRSFTQAIGTGQSVGTGLIYGPTGDQKRNAAIVQSEFNRGLGQWKIDSGRINAQLSARFPHGAIIGNWRSYRQAVTQFYRLGAVVPPDVRNHMVNGVRSFLYQVAPKRTLKLSKSHLWWKLGRYNPELGPLGFQNSDHFRRRLDYRNAYTKLGDTLLILGDAYVQRVLGLTPEI